MIFVFYFTKWLINLPLQPSANAIIHGQKPLSYLTSSQLCDNFIVFSLEELLEKYPFNICNKIIIDDDPTKYVIDKFYWDDEVGEFIYVIYPFDDSI